MRRSFASAATVFSIAALSAASALADPAMTQVPTTMRAGPSFNTAVVQSIPANAQIEVTGCGKMWCQASWRDISGYVRVTSVGPPMEGDQGAPPPPVYGGPVVVAPPVAFGWGWHGGGCCWGGGWAGGGYGWHHY
jgi:uncharacterized protein YraI